MPRHADLSPNCFLASPSDGSACVSMCTPEGDFFTCFSFYFEEGGGCIIEVVSNVRVGVLRVLRRGPSVKIDQSDTMETREWRTKRLKLEGLRYLQVDIIQAKKVLDNLIESCGQTLIDKEMWGQSWNTLNLCIYTLQFRHPDLVDAMRFLDLTRGSSSLSAKVSLTHSLKHTHTRARNKYTYKNQTCPHHQPETTTPILSHPAAFI